jgi:hypothetical protein
LIIIYFKLINITSAVAVFSLELLGTRQLQFTAIQVLHYFHPGFSAWRTATMLVSSTVEKALLPQYVEADSPVASLLACKI